MKYLQRADSFMGSCWKKTEKKWLFKRSAFCSGSVIVDPFFFSVLIPVDSVFVMFDKSIDFFSRWRNFLMRVFFLDVIRSST